MSHHIEMQIGAIRQYLEWEFPGRVRDTWWDEDSRALVFEVVHETRCHHVIVETGFIQACQDAAASLRASERADYMREARAQERRFLVLEDRGESIFGPRPSKARSAPRSKERRPVNGFAKAGLLKSSTTL